MVFNFRYSTASTHEGLQKRVGEILDAHGLKYKIDWNHSGYPFLTPKGDLVSACTQAIKAVKGINSELSTSGGTSDGRFIAPILDTQVVELGPLNATIHQVDECVSVKDLEDLSVIYYQILKNILLFIQLLPLWREINNSCIGVVLLNLTETITNRFNLHYHTYTTAIRCIINVAMLVMTKIS
jgi:hypothetical protein